MNRKKKKKDVFITGSQRDNRKGKGRFDLLPPDAIREVARHFEKGASHYGPRNWEKGQPLTRILDSLLRHAFQVLNGEDDEPHEIAVIWNALVFAQTKIWIRKGILPKELDDIPKRKLAYH
jgi:hypothetical protein